MEQKKPLMIDFSICQQHVTISRSKDGVLVQICLLHVKSYSFQTSTAQRTMTRTLRSLTEADEESYARNASVEATVYCLALVFIRRISTFKTFEE